ncbi:serine/threonine-protein kinase [Actinomadura fibrosa]|uniref:non-specific serine/threonine protein kinase n=1 Tax=Actinomadura fibrosa TaxID=111802 RepID=A0ABW2Y2R2_9ACTN|nr:serine/threonine-protein kinase [Actinomadura fibrosa]
MEQARLLGNRYRLDSVVGRGGMGTVWRAYDVMLAREVAVKEVVLPPGLSDAERNVLYERTFREARASARLSHPGVVIVHDVVEEAGRPWIVMELVLAPSLQDLLDQGPMEHRRVAEIGLQMLGALRHAHEKGILHRDVKPSNVLITDAGRVVLTDFGIAQMEGDATLTQTGLVMGSPAYIPPERAQGERAVPASDLWALGATLYAAVEGHSPYERSDAMASLQAALTEPVPQPRNAGPLTHVLEGLLAREPVHRMTAAQAQPLLTRVATLPPPPRPKPPLPPPPMTATDATVTDEASVRFGPGRDSAGRGAQGQNFQASETVMDPDELGAITRRDSGGDRYPERGRPGGESEPRTLLETDWAPPPARDAHSPRSAPPSAHGHGGPQTPPPWEQPQQYANWQQPPRAHDRAAGDRRKTLVIVTIAVILVVAAVLAGALILRGKMQANAMGGQAVMPRPVALAPSADTEGCSDTTSVITM